MKKKFYPYSNYLLKKNSTAMADNFKDLRAKLEKAAAAKKTEQPKAAEKNVKPLLEQRRRLGSRRKNKHPRRTRFR
ncbi:hypothetical protein [uncultured Parasutterella sp.]|uniref:hypothetical protein n=1 Tax=uncultured Parasutterella sp. TaxID=1263098 RepID=UPI0025B5A30B|nr:hypothetical protein [uncultured Parasutterella sp.]